MTLMKNGKPVVSYEPAYVGKKIVIGIDSSKSDSAFMVGNEYREIIDDYEIIGAGSSIDVYQLCWQSRRELKSLFEGADIIAVGIEDIITKKEKNKGLDIHMSRAKITAVFNNFIFYFQEYHNTMPFLINNNAWKSSVLPEEYNKKEIHKGSKVWMDTIGGRWAGRNDNVTDAYCITMYLYDLINLSVRYRIDEPLMCSKKFEWAVLPLSTTMPDRSKEFEFNKRYSVEKCVETIAANLTKSDSYGYMIVDLKELSDSLIFSERLLGQYDRKVERVKIVVNLI